MVKIKTDKIFTWMKLISLTLITFGTFPVIFICYIDKKTLKERWIYFKENLYEL